LDNDSAAASIPGIPSIFNRDAALWVSAAGYPQQRGISLAASAAVNHGGRRRWKGSKKCHVTSTSEHPYKDNSLCMAVSVQLRAGFQPFFREDTYQSLGGYEIVLPRLFYAVLPKK